MAACLRVDDVTPAGMQPRLWHSDMHPVQSTTGLLCRLTRVRLLLDRTVRHRLHVLTLPRECDMD